jgi:hypothetical protein
VQICLISVHPWPIPVNFAVGVLALETRMKTMTRFLITSFIALALAALAACASPPATNNNQASRNSGAQSNGNTAQASPSPAASSQRPQPPGGTIEVKSTPPGAGVVLVPVGEGGADPPQSYGVTPATVRVAPGKYLLNLEMSGYKPFQQRITVEEGKTIPINATLKKR